MLCLRQTGRSEEYELVAVTEQQPNLNPLEGKHGALVLAAITTAGAKLPGVWLWAPRLGVFAPIELGIEQLCAWDPETSKELGGGRIADHGGALQRNTNIHRSM